MKIIAISDTHDQHNKLAIPECDILIHAGDATNVGTEEEVRDFARWFSEQKARYLIWIPGNHEKKFEDSLPHSLQWFEKECPSGRVLINESINIEHINIYGSPITPWFGNWAWNSHREDIAKYWNAIPDNTNILITHGPPAKILDYAPQCGNVGCTDLYIRTQQLKQLKHHIFGHIHFSGGQTKLHNGIMYHNVAICNETYYPNNPITVIDYIKEDDEIKF